CGSRRCKNLSFARKAIIAIVITKVLISCLHFESARNFDLPVPRKMEQHLRYQAEEAAIALCCADRKSHKQKRESTKGSLHSYPCYHQTFARLPITDVLSKRGLLRSTGSIRALRWDSNPNRNCTATTAARRSAEGSG